MSSGSYSRCCLCTKASDCNFRSRCALSAVPGRERSRLIRTVTKIILRSYCRLFRRPVICPEGSAFLNPFDALRTRDENKALSCSYWGGGRRRIRPDGDIQFASFGKLESDRLRVRQPSFRRYAPLGIEACCRGYSHAGHGRFCAAGIDQTMETAGSCYFHYRLRDARASRTSGSQRSRRFLLKASGRRAATRTNRRDIAEVNWLKFVGPSACVSRLSEPGAGCATDAPHCLAPAT